VRQWVLLCWQHEVSQTENQGASRWLGANFTHKHFPLKLVYFESFKDVELAFKREKQLQGWSRKKKEALIYGHEDMLPALASCKNKTSHRLYRKLSRQKDNSDPSQPENPNPSVAED